MLGSLFGITVTLLLFLIPGYLLTSFTIFKNNPIFDRVYAGTIISIVLLIMTGFILSWLHIFTPLWTTAALMLYIISSVFLYVRYSADDDVRVFSFSKLRVSSDHIIGNILQKTLMPQNRMAIIRVLLFLMVLLICLSYMQQSLFPIGYDRGHHFGRSIYLLVHQTLPTMEAGTVSSPFYYQGQNLVLSYLVAVSTLFSGGGFEVQFQNFDSLVTNAVMFKAFFAFLLSLTLPAACVIASHLYKQDTICILTGLFVAAFFGVDLAYVGSIGTTLGFILLSLFFIYLDIFTDVLNASNKQRSGGQLYRVDIFFFLLLIVTILTVHIIASAFMFFLTTTMILWKVFNNHIDIRDARRPAIFLLIGFLFYITFLLIVYPDHLVGIVDEIFRKVTIDHGGPVSSPGSSPGYFETNFNNLMLIFPVGALLVFLVMGIILELKDIRSPIISLFLVSCIFIFVPLLPFVKTMNYVVLPFSILAGLGAWYALRDRKFGSIVVIALLVISISSMATSINAVAASKLYYNEQTYEEAYDLALELDRLAGPGDVVLFPGSGASAHLVNGLALDHTVIFAEPRYADVPEYVETSKVYTLFPTNVGVFDYSGLSTTQRYEIIDSYDISLIVERDRFRTDTEQLKIYYPEIFDHEFNNSYNLIIPGERK